MKALEEKILREGIVLPGGVLKVGSFLNQQIDTAFLTSMGDEIARLFADCGVTKILTIEASGIAIAVAAGMKMNVPVVSGGVYSAKIHSFTHNNDYDAVVSRDYISENDTVLLVDDFLAVGNALKGLIDIVEQAGAKVAGAAIAIEKGFQHGGDELRAKGYRIESLAVIDSMDDSAIIYRS